MAHFKLVERTPAHRTYKLVGWILGVGFLVYLPWFADKPARIDQFSQVVCYAVAILALDLVIGFSGQISLGHSAFVGIGAYTTVILVADHHWQYLATIPVGFVLSFLVGLLVGLPALRIRGLYLAVVTLAVATVFPTLVRKYESLTGGPNGKQAPNKMSPPSWTGFDPHSRFGPVAYRYFVLLIIAVLMFLVVRNLLHSRAGRALIALRDNSTSAAISGVNLPLYKTMVFGLSAGIAGIAGSMLMIQLPQATDTRFDVGLAIFLVVALVLGGVATTTGAIPGALLFVFIPYFTSQWTDKFDIWKHRPGRGAVAGVLYGVLLLVFVFVLPGGVIDGIRRLRARILSVAPNPAWLSQLHPHAAEEMATASFDDMAIAEPVLQQVTSEPTKETAT